MFIRIKKINNGKYAYLVDTIWTKAGPRQKVKSYLGRVWIFEQTKDLDFLKTIGILEINDYVAAKTKKEVVSDLIAWTLMRVGFELDGDFYRKDAVTYHPKHIQLTKGKKNAVIKINEGYLCEQTINDVLNFGGSDDAQKDGEELATLFIRAGIAIPKEVFVAYFAKHFFSHEPTLPKDFYY